MYWARIREIWLNLKEAAKADSHCDVLPALYEHVWASGLDCGPIEDVLIGLVGINNVDFVKSLDRVLKMRACIEAKTLETPERIAGTVYRLSNRLRTCPQGDGDGFRDVTRDVLLTGWSYVVDVSRVRKEHPCSGGKIDVVLPVRLEVVDSYFLWRIWCDRYSVRSLVAESKNQRKRADYQDVAQLAQYLKHAKLGKLGVLVSRKGFSCAAMQSIRSYARDGENLILPIDESGLQSILMHAEAPATSMEFLRRIETDIFLAA